MSDETLQTAPGEPQEPDTTGKHEACVAEAWRLLSEGVYTFRAISRGVNEKTGCSHDHTWVKRALVRHGAIVAETIESGAIDARAKYLQALYSRRAAAAAVTRDPEAKPGERIAALKLMTEIDERVAAAEGVVTKRERQELHGPNGGPLQVAATVDVARVVDDAETADLACALLDRIGRGAHDASGAGASPRDLPVPGGSAPLATQPAPDAPDSGQTDAPDGDNAAAPREE